MFIQALPAGPFDTNAYIVACPATKKAAIFDAPPDSAELIAHFLAKHQLIPEKIILTHSHWDHIGSAAELKRMFHIPILIHPLDAPNLRNPGTDRLPMFMPIEGVSPDILLVEGDEVTVGDISFKVIETPGHIPGGICLYSEKEEALISGDTLFKGSMGNISFPTCDADKMWLSLKRLAKLPASTKVYPGHGPATVLRNETWLEDAKRIFGYA